MRSQAKRFSQLLALPVLAAVACILYGPGLSGGFFFDDLPNIVHQEHLHLVELDFDALKSAVFGGSAGPSGRPVALLSFALNHYANGLDPFAFKLTNLFIHLAAGLAVWLLTRRLMSASPSPYAEWMSIAITAFFLLHPIQLLPVLHIVQRMTSLAGLFLLLAVWLHIRGRESTGHRGFLQLALAWGLFWPLAFFSKETGALFPLFALAWELALRRANTGHLDRFAVFLATAVAIAIAAGTFYVFSSSGHWLLAGYTQRDFTLIERLLTEARVIWLYLGLVFLPSLPAFGLYHDDIVLSTGPLSPWTTLPALLGLAGSIVLAWFGRKRFPLAAFGIAWFFVGHAIESTFLPLEIAHEHRNYIPLLGLLFVVADLANPLLSKPGTKTMAQAGLIAALAYFALLTGMRAHQFGDAGRRTQIEAMHHPQSSRAHFEAGHVLASFAARAPLDDPSRFFAASHYEQAGELNRSAKMPLLGLIHLDCSASRPANPRWVEELKKRLRETPFAPGDRNVLYSIKEMSIAGTLCLSRRDVIESFAAAKENRTVAPHVRMFLHSWLADYFALAERDLPKAVEELDKALAIAPHNPSNLLKRAQLEVLQQRMEAAGKLLGRIDTARLTRSEKETFELLDNCISSHASGGACGISAVSAGAR